MGTHSRRGPPIGSSKPPHPEARVINLASHLVDCWRGGVDIHKQENCMGGVGPAPWDALLEAVRALSGPSAVETSPQSPSPLAQAVLDRVDGTNLGLFITSAVDHIDKGGNCASAEMTLGSGIRVEVRLARASAQNSTVSETAQLCPHGAVLAENTCGPCSKGEPNRPGPMPPWALLLLECRDALPAITLHAARLRGLDLNLADRIEEMLKPWRVPDGQPGKYPPSAL